MTILKSDSDLLCLIFSGMEFQIFDAGLGKGKSRQWSGNGTIRKKFPLHKPRGGEKQNDI